MKNKKYIIVIALVTTLMCMSILLAGCSDIKVQKDTLNEVSDLVTIKVNNCMAQWNDPTFNYSHTGSNVLTVHVPQSNTLDITDLIVSPGSSAKVYNDSEYSSLISNIDAIDIQSEKDLYIRVTNSAKKPKHTDYIVKVIADIDNLSGTANVNNSGGHLLVEGDVATIDNVEYIVVRSYDQFRLLADEQKNLTKNYIFANDIVGSESELPLNFNNLSGILDGNNYKLNIDLNDFLIKSNNGIIKNIILDNGKNEYRKTHMPPDGTGYQLVDNNQNLIKNCVNKNNIYRPNFEFLKTFAGYKIMKHDSLEKFATIEECINYAEISGRNASGIGGAEVIKMCVNTGYISSIYIGDEIIFTYYQNRAVGIADCVNEISNCSNLGKVVGRNLASGIEIAVIASTNSVVKAVTYNINYGEMVSGEVAAGGSMSSIIYDKVLDNLNYGKLTGMRIIDLK